jgi:peptidoglycan/xylan/chitin deacetylase (PgdA/CDA1 family)
MRGASRMLATAGVHLAARTLTRHRLSILLYHRVLPQPDPINNWDVTAEEFDAQMAQLAAHFTPLPLAEAAARLARGALPPGAVCVTFDDGYADNCTVALPILQQRGIPASFFIATDFLNGGRMWNDTVVEAVRVCARDRLELSAVGLASLPLGDAHTRRSTIDYILNAIKHRPPAHRDAAVRCVLEQAGQRLPDDLMLTDAQVRALRCAGMSIGGHTARHPILANLPPDQARREVLECRDRLTELLREPITLFAYPNGKPGLDYGREHVDMVRAAGFTVAVSTVPGVATRASDPLQLPRQSPWDRNPLTFSMRLAKSYLSAASDRASSAL